MNNSFKEIADELKNAKNILIYPHVGIDGDCMGSAVALCRTLRLLGKTAYVLVEDEIPSNLEFLLKDYVTYDMDIISDDVDVSVCVDCGEDKRFPKRAEKFWKAKKKICVDHHEGTNTAFDMKHISPDSPSCGELIFKLVKELGVSRDGEIGPDIEIGEAIYTAINTDTGKFQYSSTTADTHLIVAELYSWGINAYDVSSKIYETNRPQKIQIYARVLSEMEIIASGKAAVAVIKRSYMDEIGVKAGETDGIVHELKSIEGVEYAVLIKEKDVNEIRVSLRSKSKGNVAEIAKKFGGGGHIPAAGCTFYTDLKTATDLIKEEIEKAVMKDAEETFAFGSESDAKIGRENIE